MFGGHLCLVLYWLVWLFHGNLPVIPHYKWNTKIRFPKKYLLIFLVIYNVIHWTYNYKTKDNSSLILVVVLSYFEECFYFCVSVYMKFFFSILVGCVQSFHIRFVYRCNVHHRLSPNITSLQKQFISSWLIQYYSCRTLYFWFRLWWSKLIYIYKFVWITNVSIILTLLWCF